MLSNRNESAVPANFYPAIVVSDQFSSYQLDSQSVDRLGKFYTRTVLSIGTEKAAKLYQNYAIEIACAVRMNVCRMQSRTDLVKETLYDACRSNTHCNP